MTPTKEQIDSENACPTMKVELTKAQAVQVVVFLKMLRPDLNEYGKQEIDGLVGALNPQIKEINRVDNRY